ncbi:MAG: hypothetical protein MRK02_02165 [Candidatus Scalindua sp.]|nr:hypothetical protein [Candidatus Scalindua sp.]
MRKHTMDISGLITTRWQKQSYYVCKNFATDTCPHRCHPALKNREFLREAIEKNSNKDYGTLKEYFERKIICRNCNTFMRIEFL